MITIDLPELTRDMVCAHRARMAAAAEAVELELAGTTDAGERARLDKLDASLWDAVAAAQAM
jgi:hypothetical protein